MGIFSRLFGSSQETLKQHALPPLVQTNSKMAGHSINGDSSGSFPIDSVTRAEIPDGKYLASFHSEYARENQYVLGNLRITIGDYKGQIVQLVFDTPIAKKISREYSGLWISRLDFEGNKKALDLEYAKDQAFENQFFITVKGGFVRSVLDPSNNWELIEKWLKKAKRASSNPA